MVDICQMRVRSRARDRKRETENYEEMMGYREVEREGLSDREKKMKMKIQIKININANLISVKDKHATNVSQCTMCFCV